MSTTKKMKRKPGEAVAPLDPNQYYPLAVWRRQSGLGRILEARGRAAGVELKTIHIGRCKFVRGVDGIKWLEEMAAIDTRPFGSGKF